MGTGTSRTLAHSKRRLEPMRLEPRSYFWICWKVNDGVEIADVGESESTRPWSRRSMAVRRSACCSRSERGMSPRACRSPGPAASGRSATRWRWRSIPRGAGSTSRDHRRGVAAYALLTPYGSLRWLRSAL